MVRLGDIYRAVTDTVKDPFSAATSGLPDATGTETVQLRDGGSFALKAGPVRKRLRTGPVFSAKRPPSLSSTISVPAASGRPVASAENGSFTVSVTAL